MGVDYGLCSATGDALFETVRVTLTVTQDLIEAAEEAAAAKAALKRKRKLRRRRRRRRRENGDDFESDSDDNDSDDLDDGLDDDSNNNSDSQSDSESESDDSESESGAGSEGASDEFKSDARETLKSLRGGWGSALRDDKKKKKKFAVQGPVGRFAPGGKLVRFGRARILGNGVDNNNDALGPAARNGSGSEVLRLRKPEVIERQLSKQELRRQLRLRRRQQEARDRRREAKAAKEAKKAEDQSSLDQVCLFYRLSCVCCVVVGSKHDRIAARRHVCMASYFYFEILIFQDMLLHCLT